MLQSRNAWDPSSGVPGPTSEYEIPECRAAANQDVQALCDVMGPQPMVEHTVLTQLLQEALSVDSTVVSVMSLLHPGDSPSFNGVKSDPDCAVC